MPEENLVSIVSWPKEDRALLEHTFKLDKPCPVAIVFEEQPANVRLSTSRETPLHMNLSSDKAAPLNLSLSSAQGLPLDVNMNMQIAAEEPLPVCLKICDPICADSDYSIGVNLFGQPLAEITVKGRTTIGECKEDTPTQRLSTACADFRQFKVGDTGTDQVTLTDMSVQTLTEGDKLSLVNLLPDSSSPQLVIPQKGIQANFVQPVENLTVQVINTGETKLKFRAFSGSNLVNEQEEPAGDLRKVINISGNNITSLQLLNGSKEAVVSEFCFDKATSSIPAGARILL